MFIPLGGALPVEVHAPTLSKNPDLSIKNIPTSCGRQDVLLETGTRTPSASAKAAVHHPPALGLEGRQWRTQHTRPAHSASTVQDSRGPRINVGHPQPLPKNQPTAENPNSHFFSHPSSHRLHAPTTSISFFASFASKLLGATRVSASPIQSI